MHRPAITCHSGNGFNHTFRGSFTARSGLTLLELLFATVILAALTSIVFGGIGKTRTYLDRTQEVSAARMLINAFHTASADSGTVFSAERTLSSLPSHGNAVNLRYGTFLMDYIGETDWKKTLYTHESQLKELDKYRNSDVIGLSYIYSLYPALGMNSPNVGGMYEDGSLRNIEEYSYATDLGGVHHPDKLVVFISAATGSQTRASSLIRGYFRVLPPYHQGYPEDGYMWGSVNENYPSNTGNVHFRWESKAVVAFYDGSVRLNTAKELQSRLHWENKPHDEM